MNATGRTATSWMLAALVLASALGLSACAVAPATRVAQGPAAVTLNEGQGLVALQITGNRYGQSTFSNKNYYKLSIVVVRNVDTKAEFVLRDRSDPTLGFSFFSEAMPAGVYTVVSIENDKFVSYSPGLAASQKRVILPNFRVTSGQLTDLGTIGFSSFLSISDAEVFRMGFVDAPQDPAAATRLLAPQLAARVASQPVSGWLAGAVKREDGLIDSALRKETMRVANPTSMPDGSLWMGEAMGQIAQRSKAGAWSWLQTPTGLPITAFHAKADGTVLAGNEGGGLYFKLSGARVWNAVPLPVSDAAVLHVGPYLATSKVLVVMQTGESYIGISGDPTVGEAWTQQFVVPRKYISNRIHDGIAVPLSSGEKFVLATGSVEVKPEVTFFDKAQKQWRTVPADGANSPRGWKSLPNGDIGRIAGIPLTGMYFTTSSDQGVRWEKRGEINWASGSLLFVSDKVGYVVRTDSTAAFSPSKSQYSIWKTSDAGRTWNKMGPVPVITPFGELLNLGAEDALGFVGWDGKFHVTQDGGKTWKVERTST